MNCFGFCNPGGKGPLQLLPLARRDGKELQTVQSSPTDIDDVDREDLVC